MAIDYMPYQGVVTILFKCTGVVLSSMRWCLGGRYINGQEVGNVGGEGAPEVCDAASSVRACRRASATWPFELLHSCNCYRRTYRPRLLSPVSPRTSNHTLTSGPPIPSKTSSLLYRIHTTRFPTQHLDHGSQEERRRCSSSFNHSSFDSKAFPWTDFRFISAYQAHCCICKAHLRQVDCPQLVRCSRDRFGRVGPLCEGHPPACQVD
jgi:hypothetical protein